MKPEILLFEPLVADIEAQLDEHYQVHRAFDAGAREQSVAQLGPRVRAIVTGGGTGAGHALVARLPALEIIAISGIGTDAVDLTQARERGLRVTTTPDLLTDDVADLAIGLWLSLSRQMCTGDRYVRDGHWLRRKPLPLAGKASGKKMGIVGMGRVGRAIARRAISFDMQIAYCDLRAFDDLPYRYEASLHALAQWSDCLVIAAAGGAQSQGMVDATVLDALGSQGLLVNVARGSIVDETALVDALQAGRLGGAALDVFADEPNVPPELLARDNVVLQPHRASATHETRTAMGHLLLANLAAHFSGSPLPSAVV